MPSYALNVVMTVSAVHDDEEISLAFGPLAIEVYNDRVEIVL